MVEVRLPAGRSVPVILALEVTLRAVQARTRRRQLLLLRGDLRLDAGSFCSLATAAFWCRSTSRDLDWNWDGVDARCRPSTALSAFELESAARPRSSASLDRRLATSTVRRDTCPS